MPRRESRNCLTTAFLYGFSDTSPTLPLDRFPRPATASAIPPEATVPRSAAPYAQRAASSDGSPPARASSSGHVSRPAVRPSSPAVAGSSWLVGCIHQSDLACRGFRRHAAATNSRFAPATPAAAKIPQVVGRVSPEFRSNCFGAGREHKLDILRADSSARDSKRMRFC